MVEYYYILAGILVVNIAIGFYFIADYHSFKSLVLTKLGFDQAKERGIIAPGKGKFMFKKRLKPIVRDDDRFIEDQRNGKFQE